MAEDPNLIRSVLCLVACFDISEDGSACLFLLDFYSLLPSSPCDDIVLFMYYIFIYRTNDDDQN